MSFLIWSVLFTLNKEALVSSTLPPPACHPVSRSHVHQINLPFHSYCYSSVTNPHVNLPCLDSAIAHLCAVHNLQRGLHGPYKKEDAYKRLFILNKRKMVCYFHYFLKMITVWKDLNTTISKSEIMYDQQSWSNKVILQVSSTVLFSDVCVDLCIIWHSQLSCNHSAPAERSQDPAGFAWCAGRRHGEEAGSERTG